MQINKLRYCQGTRSKNMCYEDRNSNKIATKILQSGAFELMTPIYQAGNLASTPRLLSHLDRGRLTGRKTEMHI